MEAVVPEPKDSESLRSFFTDFMDESGNYLYKEQIEALITRGKRSLIIDFDDLLRFDPDLAKKLLKSPDLFIQTFEKDFRELIESMDPEYAAKVDRFHLRFRKVPDKENLRDIRAKHIGKIIEIEGILTRVTEIKPLLIEAVFRCTYCKGELMMIPQKEGRFSPPENCQNPECGRKGGIVLLLEESTFIDWQRISIQEKPEELPPGRMPQSLRLILQDDLVDIARPGDRIKATGILRSRPEKALKPGKLATFYRYIECNFLERVESEMETQEITRAEEKQIQELGKDPWIAQKIVNSIAPSIYGYDHIKEALALLLFGGITKHLPDKTTIRGEPNVLLIGDPGTGKSQILKYIATLAPRGLYTSGKGSTAAGLTAAVIKDPTTGELNLEAGALVLSDKGIACIDEFDKMRPDDRVAIHEAMEQHTISIAKAGIVATLNARAAIIAAANPKFGRYNPYKDPADNINLPTTVLSRFDLIFIMQDKPDPKEDRLKARHILRLHERRRVVEPPIPPDSLRKYISYSKQNIRPSITTEAAERIEEFYMDMRTTDRPDSPIAITPRQLEGLIRLAEARARMRLSPEVAVEDAETAIRLVNSSLKEVGMDTETGAIDALTLMTGRSQRSRSVMERIMDIIKEMSKEVEGTQVKIQDIINKAMEEGISEAVARDTIQKLKNEGDLYEPRVGYIRPP